MGCRQRTRSEIWCGIAAKAIFPLVLIYFFSKDMHPLSVEDVLHHGGHALSKADYYPKHLFIRVLSHTLGSTNGTSQGPIPALSSSTPFPDVPRSASPQPLDEKLGILDPLADEFDIGRAAPIDPEMGRRTASLLV